MSSPRSTGVVPVLIVAGVVLVLGATVGFTVLSARPADETIDSTVASPPPPSDAALDERLAWLETEVTRLRREVQALRDRPPPARPRAAGLRAEAEGAGPAAAIEAEDTRLAVIEAISGYDPEVRDQLRAVLQEENERLREERWAARTDRWREHRLQALDEIAVRTGMTQKQKDSLASLLTDEMESMQQVFRDARQSGGFFEAREKAQQLREETDAEAHRLLDEEQAAAWDSMRAEGRGPGRGMGRGGMGRGGRAPR